MSVEERLAVLETQRKDDKAQLNCIASDVREIKATVVRSRGFIAGATTVIVPLWGLAVAAAVWVWHYITGVS